MKVEYDRPIHNQYNKEGQTESSSYKMRSGHLPLSLLLSVVLGILARPLRQEKGKRMQREKGKVKLSLFVDDIILYWKDFKHSTRILDLINTTK